MWGRQYCVLFVRTLHDVRSSYCSEYNVFSCISGYRTDDSRTVNAFPIDDLRAFESQIMGDEPVCCTNVPAV